MQSAKPLFIDTKLEEAFSRYGYVILPNLLDRNDINVLTDTYQSFSSHISQPFHTSHFSNDVIYKRTIQSAIFDVVFPKIKNQLCDYSPVFANFMVKNPTGDNFLQLHADWAYTEEKEYRTASIWIPLVDVNKQNGCLGVIEGSHAFMNKVRGPGIQQNNFNRDKIWVKKYGKLLPVNAGDAIVFDHALLHYSLANETNSARPALNMSVVPRQAALLHYCIPDDTNEIEKYSVDNLDFFLLYENWKRPQLGQPVAYLQKSVVPFIDERMENYGRTNLSILGRFASFLKEKVG
jgi:ectoine hydroxylase-related dioxygenase (phytanoyl-CoA dioxygenase family)